MAGAVTIADVAHAAGVSVATVSRALNEDTSDLVRGETRARVRAAVESLGYRANSAARTLRTRRSLSVGVLVPDITNPLFPRILSGIDAALAARQYGSIVSNARGGRAEVAFAFERLKQRGVDGMIVATAGLDDPLSSRAARHGFPVVLVNRRSSDDSVSSVTSSGRTGILDAVRWLFGHGHRDVTIVAAPQQTSTGRARLAETQSAAHAVFGRELPVRFVPSVTEAEGRRAMADLLRSARRPTAVLAASDVIAVGCIDAISEAGLKCPEDVSVVGFNNMPFSERMDPPLSTVGFDQFDMGFQSAQLLLELIKTPHSVRHIEIDAVWTPRRSTAPASNRIGIPVPSPSYVRRLADEVAASIRAFIIERNLAIGARLPSERTLAARLGASRPTVSQAIRILALMGLVETRRGSGTYVVRQPDVMPMPPASFPSPASFVLNLQDESLERAMELRHWLETMAVSRAVELQGPQQLGEARAALERLAASVGSTSSWIAADTVFHATLVGLARNPFLTSLYEDVHTALLQYEYQYWVHNDAVPDWLRPEAAEEQLALHAPIIDAIARRDTAAATAAVRHHNDVMREHLRTVQHDHPA